MTETLERPRTPRPPSRLPEILGPWDTAVWLWRRLRRMSTALLLLFGLAAASMVATFVPQEPVVAATVAQWREGTAGPGREAAAIFDALGLFDVFGSWWFAALTALLFVSLTGCLIPRIRAFAATMRRPPAAGRNLERLGAQARIATPLVPEQALDEVARELGRRRYRHRRLDPGRTASGHAQVAAERGHAREGGSLVFHLAFYVLLIGVLIAQGFGFTGQVNIAEGETFTDTRLAYGLAEPGRWFGLEDHRGFQVRLDEFEVSYFDNATPSEFLSRVTILDGGEVVRSDEIRVNDALSYDGMTLYQMRFGMAPRVVVRADDIVVFDDQVMLSDAGGGIWTGVAKVSVADPQIALELVFLPHAAVREDAEGNPQVVNLGPRLENPRLFADLWIGDLGLERPVPASEFDREGGTRLDPPAVLAEGQRQPLAGGRFSVELADVSMWSGFQVSHQPGRLILLAASGLLLVGLLPSLYSYRRRVWAEAVPTAGGSQVLLAGTALQRKERFAEEFTTLAAAVDRRLVAAHKETKG